MRRACQLLLPLLLLLMPGSAAAREGLFLRFGLGPGVVVEGGPVQGTVLALPAKDHAIGYGLTEHFAVQLADFGALVYQQVGEYEYLNLDGLGPGVTVFLPRNALVSLSAGYGAVGFARKWWEATGSDKHGGIAISASARKEWPLSRKWALGVGGQACFFRTSRADYTFCVLSAEASAAFYLVPS